MLKVHHNIKHIPVIVDLAILTDQTKTGYISGYIIGIDLYPESVPTFTVLLNDGSVFCYLPSTSVFHAEPITKHSLKDLVYHNCPNESSEVHDFNLGSIHAYLKNTSEWFNADYILTIDWYSGNDLLHLVKLSTGEFAWLPNHKINCIGPVLNNAYKKIRGNFSV